MSARHRLALLIILLLAGALRLALLTEIPPGLTHDEANHARGAIGVLDGVFLFYFPLNYGSEPLYDYTVAGFMGLLGRNLLALRLVNAFSGLLALSLTYRWARRWLGPAPALAAAALIAISFWPVATSRQALRAGMLPMLITAAVILFWQIIAWAMSQRSHPLTLSPRHLVTLSTVGFALFIALTLHNYLAARLLWLIFPAFLLLLAVLPQDTGRRIFRRAWQPALIGLILAGLMTLPMFLYLAQHPEAETRLQMLDRSLLALQDGNLAPILANARDALLAFVWPGMGDHFLAYNIPGRPVYDLVTAILFLAGAAVCLRRWRRPAYPFLLIWFGIGILPSLITGPEANTTRNIGALPAAYLIPATGLTALAARVRNRLSMLRAPCSVLGLRSMDNRLRITPYLAIAPLLILIGWAMVRDYFVRWAQAPEVRAAYQHTLVEMLAYWQESAVGAAEQSVVSTVHPGAAHDPSIALLLSPPLQEGGRWVDARSALIFPAGGQATMLAPTSATPHAAFNEWATPSIVRSLPADALDPGFTVYLLQPPDWAFENQPVDFGGAVLLLGARWLDEPARPGSTATLMTVWQLLDPARLGPPAPPTFTAEVVFFTHVLRQDGTILAQRDALDAPAWSWQPDDVVVQLHTVELPPTTPPGLFEAVAGIYNRHSGERLSLINTSGATTAPLPPLRVTAP